MIQFILSNIGTIVVGILVLSAAVSAAVSIVRNKKKGISSCGCNCGSCPMSRSCHK